MSSRTPSLFIEVMGSFAVFGPDGLQIDIKNRKGMCILGYMALSGMREVRREQLQCLLWSEKDKEKAQGSLRNSVKHIVDCVGSVVEGAIWRDKRALFIDLENIKLDIEETYVRAKSGDFQSILNSNFVPEEILLGTEKEDSAFVAWLHVIRNRWREKFVSLLEARCSGQLADKYVDAARALISIEPTHEGAYRALISHHAQSGNTGKALDLYKQLYTVLDTEFDTEPSRATIELIGDVKMGRIKATSQQDSGNGLKPAFSGSQLVLSEPLADIKLPTYSSERYPDTISLDAPRIGIAQFVQSGFWRSETFLIEGFRRDLIAALVRFREWIVTDTGSEFLEQEADYILEGGYQDNVGTVRLTITLKQTATGAYLWSEPLEFGFDRWLEAQNEIVRRIAIALNVSVAYHHMTRARRERGLSSDLYGRWLQGQELLLEWHADSHRRATEIFFSIIEERPDFARAYSSLAQMGNAEAIMKVGHMRTKESIGQTVHLAEQAVDADPLDSRAHLALAWARMSNEQFELAEMELEHASNLNANDPWTLVSVGLGWAYCGNREKSDRYSDLALRLGLRPSQSHWGYQTCRRYLLDDFEGCIEAAEEGGEAFHNLPAWAAASHIQRGQHDEAEAAANRFRKIALREWNAATEPTDAAILNWLLQCFPIRSPQIRKRFRNDLITAGLYAA